jgi:hypothetical protein
VSIQRQTRAAWRLLIRDDGSTDDTREIVKGLQDADPRIELVEDDGAHLGCVGNYGRLALVALERGARYVMLADQDDLWQPQKIEATLSIMRVAEEQYGSGCPLLVHTDLELVTEDLATIAPSFMGYQGIRHETDDPLKTLLVQNFVTGCTTLLNRALLERAIPIPAVAPMHDWWFALCAAAVGRIEFLPKATGRYRQHGANVVAAKGRLATLNPFRTSWPRLWRLGRIHYRKGIFQARTLLDRVGEPRRERSLLEGYLGLFGEGVGPLTRAVRAARGGFRAQSAARTMLLYIRMMFMAPDLSEIEGSASGLPG